MTFAPIKTPLVAKKMFPNYIWDIPSDEKVIYLTFDDGPTPEITDWTLNTLRDFNALATFFCIGNNIEKHPDIFSNIIHEGHTIGNHTQNHIKGWKTKTKDYLKNVAIAQEVLDLQIQNSKFVNRQSQIVNLFRPPYGQITPKQGKKIMGLGYNIIMWDVLSFDWDQETSPDVCLTNVITKAKKGSIVVFHDSIKASKNMQYALPKVLQYFAEKGFQFKPIN